jgi:hypothetical protein
MNNYTILIPYVPSEFRTQWHPTDYVGPFSVLQRGAFTSIADAITWAQLNLNGTPYSVRPVE